MLGNTHDNLLSLDEQHYAMPLLAKLLESSHARGKHTVIAQDITSPAMHYHHLILRSLILKNKLAAQIEGAPYVALLLPNTLACLVTFFGLHMLRMVPCMLNFTAGPASVQHACKIAGIRTVITSRVFIEKAKIEHLLKPLQKQYKIIYLEDVRDTVSAKDKLTGALLALCPKLALQQAIAETNPHGPAVILYTSGSEGTPKGVALSHANILSNIAQAYQHLGLTSQQVVFNALPLFHSFGLTVGLLMPVITGMRTYLYPSPVHYKQIPEEVEKSGATVMLGTDTFYQGYAKYATKEQFKNVQIAVAGAEKLKEPTREHWLKELGVEILQGYGVTESSPVISVNTHADHRPGTVGRMVAGMQYKLQELEGLTEGKELLVKGPNIMLGYLKTDKPGVIQPHGEWYDTGDIVDIDADGFITILGRAKRFAKIAGEMVSLAVVEELAAGIATEEGHAAIAIPDEKRGEQIILYTESAAITKEKLLEQAKKKGIPEICLPKQVHRIDVIPRLGSGKVDYMSLKDSMARSS